jgi:chloramphenicol-sensitive protein RarD
VVATIWFRGESAFFTHAPADGWLLLGTGLVTAVPLILFAYGAKRLRLTTIGFLQYIAPTMIFLMAVLVFGEEFRRAQSIAFPMIWAALVLYTISLVRHAHGSRKAQA